MKKRVLSLLLIGLFLFLTSCGGTGDDPFMPELRLVPLTTGDLAKAVTLEDGSQYMPASEIPAIMAKRTSADIDFGNMAATKTLQYVLMNVGNTDVYDITFVANDLNIYPTYIPLVPTPEEGGDLIALPIISFTKEHVIPSSGVGSYLDFEIGAFNDVMTLCYNYDLSHTEIDSTYDGDSLIVSDTVIVDSFDIADEYTVAGVKAGAFIEIWMSGVKWEDYGLIGEQYDYGSIPMMSGPAVWQDDVGTIIVKNTGNVSLQMRLINPYSEDYDPEPGVVVIDTLLNPGIEIDLSDKFICPLLIPNSGDDPTKGTMLFFGAEVNQPYLFTLLDVLCTTGILGMYSDPIQPY